MDTFLLWTSLVVLELEFVWILFNRCMNDFGGDRKAMWASFFNLRKEIEKAQAIKVRCEVRCVMSDVTGR